MRLVPPEPPLWHSLRAALVLSALSLALVGCEGSCGGDSQRAWSAAYDQLTASLSDVDAAPLNPQRYQLPRLRDRALAARAPITISARSLLALSSCEVSRWIAQRNSPLGRVMLPSQRLLYEARFLSAAPSCEVEGEPKRALDEAAELKRARWRERLWDLTWRGRELSRFLSWSWPRDRLPPRPSEGERAALRWLGSLGTWAETLKTLEREQRELKREELKARLEPALSSLSAYAGGRVIREAAELESALERWLKRLESLEAPPSCERVEALLSAYRALQPELSARVIALGQLSRALQGLSELMNPSPESMRALLLDALSLKPSGLSERLKALSKRHVTALQAQLQRCGLSPQGSSSPSPSGPSSSPSSSPPSP